MGKATNPPIPIIQAGFCFFIISFALNKAGINFNIKAIFFNIFPGAFIFMLLKL